LAAFTPGFPPYAPFVEGLDASRHDVCAEFGVHRQRLKAGSISTADVVGAVLVPCASKVIPSTTAPTRKRIRTVVVRISGLAENVQGAREHGLRESGDI
jgi:hypothetical protein